MTQNPRYAGKPLLRLLECYVLWAIDELPSEHAEALHRMEPKLQKTYGLPGSWQEVIASVMGFSPALPERVRELWRENCELAREHGDELTPQAFAEMVIDENIDHGPARG